MRISLYDVPWPITSYTLKNTTIKSYAHFAVRLCHNVTFSGSTYGSSKRMTWTSPEGTRYHSSLRISRAVMNPEKPNLGHDSYGTWKERTWNQCFQLIQSELTSRDCVSNQLRILDKSPLRPHFSFRMRKRTFWGFPSLMNMSDEIRKNRPMV